MKSIKDMTPAQIRQAAHQAIIREIGVAGLVRFLSDQSLGSGDYTRDRWQWLSDYESADALIEDVRNTVGKTQKDTS